MLSALFSVDNMLTVINANILFLATVENMKVVEEIDTDTLVFHQVHKRVWPATQRDAVFWSHMRRVPNDEDQDAHDIWIVANNSTEHDSSPVSHKF